MFASMKMGFPTGMAGGGITQFLQPLQEYLSQQVVQQQVQPFITEVSDEAQERFNLGGTGSNDIFSGGIFNAGGSDFFSGNDTGVSTAQPYDHISSSVPPPLPAVQQPVIGNNDMYIGNDHVGDGLLMAPMPDIDQGFFDSQEYLDFMSKPQMGTSDVYLSRYFGQMGSSSLGGMQEKAYEDYLNRTGQTGLIRANNPNSSPGGLADGFGNIFELPSTNPVYDPGSKELADYAANFNNNVQPGSLTYMDPKTGMIAY
jgi:hypothetical protein